MSRGYETFEHTADIGIRAWGSNLAEVFEEAAKALFSIIVDLETVTPRQKLKVELTADSSEELFFNWLKELLFISETKHIFLREFKVLDLSPTKLLSEVRGEPVDPKRHIFGKEVKAITRHQFKLVHEKSRHLAEVILDI